MIGRRDPTSSDDVVGTTAATDEIGAGTDTFGPLAGRVAVVTGAAGDIGSAVAVRLTRAGARVVLADLTDAVEDTARRCVEAGASSPITLTFDVTDERAVETAFDELAARGVTADLLVNNAGHQGSFANTVDHAVTDFRHVLDVNVTGVFLVLRTFARRLISAGAPGAIVNTASMAQGGAPNMVAYSASKAAVVAMTKTAAKDLAHHGIRVNSISPAFIGPGEMWDRQVRLQAETTSAYYADDPDEVADQMIASVPLRRYGSLDEVAAAVQYLLSDESSYVTAFDLHVSGGAV